MCNRCGRPFASSAVADHLCGDCIEKPPPFDSVHFLWSYESVVQEIIQRMKYRRMQSLARFLGVLLADHLAERLGRLQPHLIVPIPLHGKRLRMRGFNQAAVMARPLARRLGLRVDVNLLRKIQDTPSQVGLSRSQREENVRGSFSVDHGGRIRGRRLILVDDVFTTGATLKEAARALKRAKASEIHVATLARVT
jgi:ComF family protein